MWKWWVKGHMHTSLIFLLCFAKLASGRRLSVHHRQQCAVSGSELRTHLPSRRPELSPWVRKIPGGGNGNPLQYSCLENPMDRGAWQARVCGVAKRGDRT